MSRCTRIPSSAVGLRNVTAAPRSPDCLIGVAWFSANTTIPCLSITGHQQLLHHTRMVCQTIALSLYTENLFTGVNRLSVVISKINGTQDILLRTNINHTAIFADFTRQNIYLVENSRHSPNQLIFRCLNNNIYSTLNTIDESTVDVTYSHRNH